MQINTLKSQKTSGGLSNLYVNDWEDKKNKIIRMGTLYLVSCYLQGLDWGPAELKKWSQCNESSFYLSVRPQDLKGQL